MKQLEDLVGDVYRLMESKELAEGVDLESEADHFAAECKQILMSVMQPDQDRTGKLRLSGIGKPMRQQYNQYHGIPGEDIEGATYIKFLYGHLIEAMIVSLARMSGHTVEDQQKEVEVAGVKGHIDGRVDGVLCDIKSASAKAFKKFRYNKLHTEDSFGYIGQLKAYAHAEGDDNYAWIALDKTTGQLAVLHYHEGDVEADYHASIDYDIVEHIETVKKAMAGESPPALCYSDVPVGKGGNRGLDVGCAFCPYKFHCWEGLRAFQYANYTQYLTVVDNEPRVEEIPSGF